MKEPEYTYYAFISYNHRDEKWAKLIQRKLEHYRLPSIARKEVGEDIRIRPVFRYVTNLSLGDLRENIAKELETSKYLIVVCSPNSAQPNIRGVHWVNDEIKRFISLGRANRILPIIIEGIPNSGDSRECFPPALRDADIAGADIANGSRQDRKIAFLKIIARLLDLQPDQLIRHTEAEERRKKRLKWLKILPLFILCLLGGLFAWDSTRVVERYFADYEDSFGLPEGILQLNEEQIKGRYFHFRFEYCGYQYGPSPHADSSGGSLFCFRRKLTRVVKAHSSGYPISANLMARDAFAYTSTAPIQDFEYDSHNRLQQIRFGRFNGKGKQPVLERRLEFYNEGGVTNGLVKFFANAEGQLTSAYGISRATASKDNKRRAEITQHLISRTSKGRVKSRRFLNLSNANVSDADGVFGFEYEYDNEGREIAVWYIAPKGSGYVRCPNSKGVAGIRYTYKRNLMDREEFVGADDQPIRGEKGWAIFEIARRDDFGNPVLQIYKDAHGSLTLNNGGYAQMENKFDDAGNIICQTYYDASGNKTPCDNGYVAARLEYDSYGNRTRVLFLDASDNPTWHKDGYAELDMEYDSCGNITKETNRGITGELVPGNNGVAIVETEYDEDGYDTRISYLGTDGLSTFCDEGYSGIRYMNDQDGKLTEMSYLGLDGEHVFNKNGVAKKQFAYDKRGNLTGVSFFDTNGEPTTSSDGYASMVFEYDLKGNITSCSVFDIAGKRALDEDGVASTRMEYDKRGNLVKESYFGLNAEAVLSRENNAAICEYEYDSKGNCTKKRLLDTDGKPARDDDEIYGWERKYDAQGREIQITYLNADGDPKPCIRGYSDVKFEYDTRGNLTKESFFWGDNPVVDYKTGISVCTHDFNENGREILTTCFGIDGKLVMCKEGYSQRRYEYDERGRQIKGSNFGMLGEPIADDSGAATLTVEYGACNRIVRFRSFDADGKRTLCNEGYAEKVVDYDVRGNVLTNSLFNINGKLIGKNVFRYNTYGRRLSCFAEDTITNSIVRWKYDKYGKITEINDGNFVISYSYDLCGRVITNTWKNCDGNLICGPYGWSEVRYSYDSMGRYTIIEFTDIMGEPAVSNGEEGIIKNSNGESEGKGCCKQRFKYHGNSHIISEVDTFSLTNHPCLWGVNGLWHEKSIRNERGEDLSLTWYNSNGQRLPMSPVPYFLRVHKNSNAEKAGVQEGDIMCCFNGYMTIGSGEDVDFDAVRWNFHNGKSEKTILYARKTGPSWSLHRADFSGGVMGLAFAAKMVSDKDIKEMVDAVKRNDYYIKHSKTPQMVVVTDVVSGSFAAQLGLSVGDVVCNYGGYDIMTSNDTYEFGKANTALRNKKKDIVVARKSEGSFTILTYSFPEGVMGFRFDTRENVDYEKIKLAYQAFRKSKEKQ